MRNLIKYMYPMQLIESARKRKLLENLQQVTDRIAAACLKAGRASSEVELLAVTKYADPLEAAFLIESGKVLTAGESKVQDAEAKWVDGPLAGARKAVTLHFIGHLQSNKSARAVELFDWIDSVDTLQLAGRISRLAAKREKKMPVLVQLKLTASDTQGGISPAEAPGLLAEMRKLPFLCPSGYMAIAPETEAPETLRPLFAEVKKMFDRDFPGAVNEYGFRNHLSLGMSGDFETAVQEGSNLPRIGSLLFS